MELKRLLYWRQDRGGQITRDGTRAGPDLTVPISYFVLDSNEVTHNRVYVAEFGDEALLVATEWDEFRTLD
jgi:hypothetical protein